LELKPNRKGVKENWITLLIIAPYWNWNICGVNGGL